ncbi:MAG: ABC transporter permease [Propionibacteriaceae bacterium]|nr:ABC transporter permease [Propionibacteriaceae bacterium]
MDSSAREIVIGAHRSGSRYWRDLWGYRELFLFLAWRDILVRYKQTVIGALWALIRPVLTMAVFVVIFGRIAKLPSDGIPYPLLVFAALLPWQFFASAVADAADSLISNSSMISKVYFPRLVVPASSIIVSFVDLAISFAFLGLLMAWYGVFPGWRLLALPPFLLLAVAAALGPALLISALNVEYRDFRYIVPFAVQFGLYLSPVGFSSSIVPAEWRLAYSLNPMVGVIDGFRWALLPQSPPPYWPGLLVSCCVIALLLVVGISHFRRTERRFADVI